MNPKVKLDKGASNAPNTRSKTSILELLICENLPTSW